MVIKEALGEFAAASRAKYGDYAYTAGYLETLAASMFRSLPKAEQESILRQIEKSIQLLKENV